MLLGRIRGSVRRGGRGGGACQADQYRRAVGVALVSVLSARARDGAYGCCSARRRCVERARVAAAADQEPVEAVAADGADPAFGERVCLRRAKRGADDLDAFAVEDLVEGATELAVTVVDQEAGRCRSPGE